MTDQDIIRAGVELADGWDLTHIYDGEDIVTVSGEERVFDIDFVLQKPTQAGKDALVAQLVRQLHAADPERLRPYPYHDDPMDTIRDIVDSKVLA